MKEWNSTLVAGGEVNLWGPKDPRHRGASVKEKEEDQNKKEKDRGSKCMWEELKEEDWERGRVRDADLTGWVTDRHSAGFWSLVLCGICDTDGEQASRSSTVP